MTKCLLWTIRLASAEPCSHWTWIVQRSSLPSTSSSALAGALLNQRLLRRAASTREPQCAPSNGWRIEDFCWLQEDPAESTTTKSCCGATGVTSDGRRIVRRSAWAIPKVARPWQLLGCRSRRAHVRRPAPSRRAPALPTLGEHGCRQLEAIRSRAARVVSRRERQRLLCSGPARGAQVRWRTRAPGGIACVACT